MKCVSCLFLLAFTLPNQVSAIALATNSNTSTGSSSLLHNAANLTAENTPTVAILTSSYPKVPFEIRLPRSNSEMTIYAVNGLHRKQKDRINLSHLRKFIHDYKDDITREYRVQGYMPRIARDWTIDPESVTYVQFNSLEAYGTEAAFQRVTYSLR